MAQDIRPINRKHIQPAMMKITVYHGSDVKLSLLNKGAFVTRRLSDAWRFGYRRAVCNENPNVFVYAAEVEECVLARDSNRDRAFVLKTETPVTLLATADKWCAPFKLGRLKRPLPDCARPPVRLPA